MVKCLIIEIKQKTPYGDDGDCHSQRKDFLVCVDSAQLECSLLVYLCGTVL